MREHPDKRRHLDLRRAVLGRAFPLGIALFLLVSCASWARAQVCNNIDQKNRQALQALVQVHYPAAGGAPSDCGETGRPLRANIPETLTPFEITVQGGEVRYDGVAA